MEGERSLGVCSVQLEALYEIVESFRWHGSDKTYKHIRERAPINPLRIIKTIDMGLWVSS